MNGRPALRTYFWISIGVYSFALLVAVTIAFLWRADAHSALERALSENLSALSVLSDIRVSLRRLGWTTERYAETGGKGFLNERRRITEEVVQALSKLEGFNPSDRESAMLAGLRTDLRGYVARTESRRRRAPSAEGVSAPGDRGQLDAEPLLEALKNIRELNLQQLERQRRVTQAASFYAFLAVAASGVGSAWLLAFLLSKRIARPIGELTRSLLAFDVARGWEEGMQTAGTREVFLLQEASARMAARLKVQYESLKGLVDMRSRLVSLVSHEYANAMTSILGGVALLDDEEELPAERKRHIVSIIRASAKTLAAMAEEFLGLARGGSDKLTLELRPVDLGAILRRAAAFCDYQLRGKAIELTCRVPDDLPMVKGHPASISFVVNNILGNAIKYSRQNGRVEVGAAFREGTVECWVDDDGVGMDEEILRHVLSGVGHRPLDARSLARGFGIGLSLVRDVLHSHGSQLAVRTTPGKGSRVSFRLGVADAGVSERAAPGS
ncbi:MAG: HAMP domain-containing sensor histidine kinase [Elusimicrobiota bacterium]